MLASQVPVVGSHEQPKQDASNSCSCRDGRRRCLKDADAGKEPNCEAEQKTEGQPSDKRQRGEAQEQWGRHLDTKVPKETPRGRERGALADALGRHALLVLLDLAEPRHTHRTP